MNTANSPAPVDEVAASPIPKNIDRLSSTLHKTFGFKTFRPHQRELVEGLLAGRDAFGLMPTGGGKSLCYQLPAVLADGCAIVVSPLIALMKDQVDAACTNGIRAACLNSSVSAEERAEAQRAYREGTLDLLYIAPERLALGSVLADLTKCPTGAPAFFAIDEAHCISEWGHNFRPDYLCLANIRDQFPNTPVAAFTATATQHVADDIQSQLKLRDPVRVRASFDRENLFYDVRAKRDWQAQIVDFIRAREAGDSGIVYRTSRKDVERTAALLRDNGIDAVAYHAGMESEQRGEVQEMFIRDNAAVIVATVAFGMGIDKPDVRFVVHGDLPKNIESYYQETGRAGRDGDPSHCLLLYAPGDAARFRKFASDIDDETERARSLQLLQEMERFATVPRCRRTALLEYFGERYGKDDCGACDVCTGEFESIDATRDAQILLSAIARTEERFGAAHLCDLVTGADTEKIRKFRHDRLKTYGAGKGHPKSHWRSIVDNLLAEGVVRHADDGYAVPKLTQAAHSILKGEREFILRRDARVEPERDPSRSTRRGKSAAEDIAVAHPALLDDLRALRKELADSEAVPPYVIFADRTLRLIAATMPTSRSLLGTLHGVGSHKLEKYSEPFIACVSEYLTRNPGAEADRQSTAGATAAPAIRRPLTATYLETHKLLSADVPLSEIAAQRGIALSTVEGHIAKLIEHGEDIDWRTYVPVDLRETLAELFGKHGTDSLVPIVETASGTISYGQARIYRAAHFPGAA